MPAALSNYGRQLVMNALLRGTSFTAPSTVYLAMYLTDPTSADTGTEVTAGDYHRMPITLSSPTTGGVCSNVGIITFPTATVDWTTVTHAGIRDAFTGGHLLFHGALSSPITINAGDALEFLAGQITCTLT